MRHFGVMSAGVDREENDALIDVPPVTGARSRTPHYLATQFLCQPPVSAWRPLLTNLLCECSIIVPILAYLRPSRRVSKSRPDERVCPRGYLFTMRTFPSGDVFGDAKSKWLAGAILSKREILGTRGKRAPITLVPNCRSNLFFVGYSIAGFMTPHTAAKEEIQPAFLAVLQ